MKVACKAIQSLSLTTDIYCFSTNDGIYEISSISDNGTPVLAFILMAEWVKSKSSCPKNTGLKCGS